MAIEQRPLRDLVRVIGGGTPSRTEPQYWGGEIPWATVKDLSGPTIARTQECITQAGLENSAANIVAAGTVILATRIVPGRAALTKVDLAINQDLKGLVANDEVDPAYLMQFLRSMEPQLERAGVGSTVKGVTLETLARIRIPLPPLAEQRRIAAALDKADAIRRKRRESLQLLDNFCRSAYSRLVGPESPGYGDWPQYAIADLAERGSGTMRTGPFGSALRHSEFTDQGDVAVLGIDNVVENRFRWVEPRFISRERYDRSFRRYTVEAGDVLVSIMGTTGRSAVAPSEIPVAISTKHLAVITVDKKRVCPEFLSYALHADARVLAQIRVANRGAIMAGLNLGVIRRLKLRLPPISDQQAFVDVLARASALKSRIEETLRTHQQLLESLFQRFFAGGRSGPSV